MLKRTNGQLEWLEFELLQPHPEVVHGVFLRKGGKSSAPYDSLNASFYVGDDAKSVETNLSLMAHALSPKQSIPWTWARSTHGTDLIPIETHLSSQKAGDGDGLITQLAHQMLIMTHADCQIALFYDPIHKVIANIHSGWRSSVANIYRSTVERLHQLYDSSPSDLLVCISPSLGPNHAEFINYQTELPPPFWNFQTRPNHFDFWAISEHQLQEAGILSHHIECARECTYQNKQDFFSYRRDKITGRNATCIMMVK